MAMMYGGMLYFPLKVNLFEEIAVELVEARFGLKGTAVQDTQGKRILPEMERGAMHTVHQQGRKGHQ